MSGHHFVFDFNMTEQLGKQALDFCESFVQLSKQCLSHDCQNNVSFCKKKKIQLGLASKLTPILFPQQTRYSAQYATYFCCTAVLVVSIKDRFSPWRAEELS